MKRFEKPEISIKLFGNSEIKCDLEFGGDVTDSVIPGGSLGRSMGVDTNVATPAPASPKATAAPSTSSAFY